MLREWHSKLPCTEDDTLLTGYRSLKNIGAIYVTLLLIVCFLCPVLAVAQNPNEEEPDRTMTPVRIPARRFKSLSKTDPHSGFARSRMSM
jgi:hypothetical protein